MKNIIILGHENPDVDSIVSGYLLEKIMIKLGYNASFLIPDRAIEKETIDILNKYNFDVRKYMKDINLEDKDNKYVLVDHNDRKLNGNIVCIIDHHPSSKDIKLDNYYNKKISSTACFICMGNEYLLDKYDLKLAILATFIDTASFHTTKSRTIDKEWVLKICKQYNFDYNELYNDGLLLTNLDDLEKSSLNGLKKYSFYNLKVESSYIQIHYIDREKINSILNILKKYVYVKKLDAFVFIVHNMGYFKSKYYLITRDNVISKAYDKYTSRGNVIIPEVEKLLKINQNNK